MSENEDTGDYKRAEDDEADWHSPPYFNQRRLYPFRDCASARKTYFAREETGSAGSEELRKMVVLGETQMVNHWKRQSFE